MTINKVFENHGTALLAENTENMGAWPDPRMGQYADYSFPHTLMIQCCIGSYILKYNTIKIKEWLNEV